MEACGILMDLTLHLPRFHDFFFLPVDLEKIYITYGVLSGHI